MMCCPSDVRYGSVGVPPPSGAPQVRYFHACSSTGLRSTISSNDISIRDDMSIIGPTSRAIRAIWRFCKLPRLISDIILSAPADSDHPLFTFDINRPPRSDLHQQSGPSSCSFLICSISYPSLITLSTAVCLPLFSGVIDFL